LVAGDIVTPGHTEFARMFRLPRIWAMRRVVDDLLVIPYPRARCAAVRRRRSRTWAGRSGNAVVDELTIEPDRCSTAGITALDALMIPKLTAKSSQVAELVEHEAGKHHQAVDGRGYRAPPDPSLISASLTSALRTRHRDPWPRCPARRPRLVDALEVDDGDVGAFRCQRPACGADALRTAGTMTVEQSVAHGSPGAWPAAAKMSDTSAPVNWRQSGASCMSARTSG
jgi:hypothetical protein